MLTTKVIVTNSGVRRYSTQKECGNYLSGTMLIQPEQEIHLQ